MESVATEGARKRPSRGSADRLIVALEVLAGVGVVAAVIGKAYGAAATIFFSLCALAAAFSGYVMLRMASAWKEEALDLSGRIRDLERERLEQEKLILLQGIKELEADAAIGKVDARDYLHLRRTAEQRAIEIIAKLEEDDARWMARAEALVARRLGGSRSTLAPDRSGGRTTPGDEVKPAALAVWDGPDEPAARALFDEREVGMNPREPSPGVDALAAALVCGGCGTVNEADGRYCTGCGRPRAGTRAAREDATQEGST